MSRRMFGSDDTGDTHVLDQRETYLMSNCTRHAETGGIILGVPLAVLGKVLAQRRFPGANPYLVGFLAGPPAFLATYVTVSSLYFSKICWGYLRLLPEDSVLKTKLCEADERYNTLCVPYNRTRAFHDVMFWDKQATIDRSFNLSETAFLSRKEKHDIQKELRWVPSEKYRIVERIREYLAPDPRVEGYLKKMDDVGKVMFTDIDPATTDERLKNAAKPMPLKPT